MSIIIDFVPEKSENALDEWRFHSGETAAATRWLIKNILPETGAALISGQWGNFKTTVALDIATSVMILAPFAGRFAVKRQGGVACFALEGAGGLASRLTAIAQARGPSAALPFAYRPDCPPLTAVDALDQLTAMVEHAAKAIQTKFSLPTVLVLIDTLIGAAGYVKAGDDNDAAVAQRIMSVLSRLSQRTGALVVGIDHFGKLIDTGTRGSSAKEGHADAVLALLADRELNGTVTNTRLAVRKLREGLSGLEIPFKPTIVQTGIDPDGDPITRVVIDWEAQLIKPADADWSKSLRLLRQVLMGVLAGAGREMVPFTDEPAVRAVDIELVRAEFYRQYPTDGNREKKTTARRQAFHRAVKDAQSKGLVATREVEGVQWIWLTRPEAS